MTILACALVALLVGVAIGRWWVPSEAVIEQRREAKERELERPEHDIRRALEIAQNKSELSRLKGTGFGGGA